MSLKQWIGGLFLCVVFSSSVALADWRHNNHNRHQTRSVEGKGNITGLPGAIPGVLWREPLSGDVIEHQLRLADLDNDGTPEVLLASHGRVQAYSLDGTVKWVTPAVGVTQLYDVLDVNADGHRDVVAFSKNSGGRIWFFDALTGALTWTSKTQWPSSGAGDSELLIANIDADEPLELIWSSDALSTNDINVTQFNPADGTTSTQTQSFSGYNNGTPLLLGDVDGDGTKELVFYNYKSYSVWELGADVPTPQTVYTDASPHYVFGPLYLLDIDQDKSVELVFMEDQYNVGIGAVDPGNATSTDDSRTWGCHLQDSAKLVPTAVAWTAEGEPGDMNGDGIPDIAWALKSGPFTINPDYGPCPDSDKLVSAKDHFVTHIMSSKDGSVLDVLHAKPIAYMDYNNDGQKELIAVSETGDDKNLYHVYGYINGVLTKLSTFPLVNKPALSRQFPRSHTTWDKRANTRNPVMYDVDGDNDDELLVYIGNTFKWVQPETGDVVGDVVKGSCLSPQHHWKSPNEKAFWFAATTSQQLCIKDATLADKYINKALPRVSISGPNHLHAQLLHADLDGDGSAEELLYRNKVYDVQSNQPQDGLEKRFSFGGGANFIVDQNGSEVPQNTPVVVTTNAFIVTNYIGNGDVAWSYNIQTDYSDYWISSSTVGAFTTTTATDVALVLDHKSDKSKRKLVIAHWDGKAVTTPVSIDLYRNSIKRFFAGPHHGSMWALDMGALGAFGQLDGLDDLMIHTDDANWYYLEGKTGQALAPSTKQLWSWHAGAALANVDADPELELFHGWFGTSGTPASNLMYDIGPYELGQNYSPEAVQTPKWQTGVDDPGYNFGPYTVMDLNGGGADIVRMNGNAGIFGIDGNTGELITGYPVYFGSGAMTTKPPTSPRRLVSLLAFDVNGDGQKNILFGADDGWIYALGSSKSGAPSLVWSMYLGSPVYRVQPMDWNGDGIQELVATGAEPYIYGIGAQSESVVITSPTSKEVLLSPNITLKGTATGVTSVDVYLNGQMLGKAVVKGGNWSKALTLPNGESEVTVKATSTTGKSLVDSANYNYSTDYDGDGVVNSKDCLDQKGHLDKTVYPNAPELCDNKDNDCDGNVESAGIACDDNNPATHTDLCQNPGVCQGTAFDCTPKLCEDTSAPNGTDCTVTYSAAGTACDDKLVATKDDVCDGKGGCAGQGYTCEVGLCEDASAPNGTDCTPTYSAQATVCDDTQANTKDDVCDGKGGCAGQEYTCEVGICEDASAPNGTDCTPTYSAQGTACDDKDNATGADVCDGKGACAGTAISCSPKACEDKSEPNGTDCTPTYSAQDTGCDDGNPGTKSDVCDGKGTCSGTPFTCEVGVCQTANEPNGTDCIPTYSAQGTQCDDNDPTTSNDLCDGNGGCAGTLIECAPKACEETSEPNGTDCTPTYSAQNTTCDDGDTNTKDDVCDGQGVCGGTTYTCEAGLCESESLPNGTDCTPSYSPAGTLCDDSSTDTKDDVCDGKGGCAGTTIVCELLPCQKSGTPNGKDCTIELQADGEACDDDDKCTVGDQCLAGACSSGQPDACDDNNPCTDDSCDPKTGCIHVNNTAACDDGDQCTDSDVCTDGTCTSGAAVDCNDSNECTDDSCDSQTGCVNANNTQVCDDGSACTTQDACADGACVGGAAVECNDGNDCTDDSCDPKTGCVSTNNTVPCDDGTVCTQDDACKDGECESGPQMECGDDNDCTDDKCDPALGCVNTNNTNACDDGAACTENDQCKDGACVSGDAKSCDDNNPCTTDSCNADTGECEHSGEALTGDACGDGQVCEAGACGGPQDDDKTQPTAESTGSKDSGGCAVARAGSTSASPALLLIWVLMGLAILRWRYSVSTQA